MKKVFCLMIIVILVATIFCGCNKQLVDLTYKFDHAILSLPNGEVIEGEVQSWKDYEDGDQIQVKIDGTTYLVHSGDVVLIAD